MNFYDLISVFSNDRGHNYNNNAMSTMGQEVPSQYGANGSIPALDLISTPQGETNSFLGLGKGGGEGGMNFLGEGGMLDFGLQGLQTIAGIVNANKVNKLARDQFNFQKGVANTNLNNTISSYNTRLSDRARSRGFVEGQSQSQIDDYINKNKLSR